MCRAVKCRSCAKTTWAGCGAHVVQVMAHVAPADRCRCQEERRERPKGSVLSSFLSRFTGR